MNSDNIHVIYLLHQEIIHRDYWDDLYSYFLWSKILLTISVPQS